MGGDMMSRQQLFMVGPHEKEDVMQPTQGLMTRLPDTQYAAIYARVSTEDQGKGFSIPTQKVRRSCK
jgi:hypothetical protein